MTTPPFARFSRPRPAFVGERPRLVLGGSDPATRALVRVDLERSEPGLLVLEALDAWELLQLAPRAELVVLAGDLRDAPAESMVRLLAHRHPDLNVISLAARPADPATAR